MARKLFGTDGIRGTANREPMTAEIALKVAMASAVQFRRGHHQHRVVIGKDTRLSGYLLEPAMTAGFIAMGMDVMLVGPMPTPAVAMLTRSLRADLGVVISASHNPYQDNGIKLFGPDGFKLADEVEAAIEANMAQPLTDERANPSSLGRASRITDAGGRYIEYVKSTFPRQLRLDGLRIVVDCANGAAYKVAPAVLYELGATVFAIGNEPDGLNINRDCGATYLDTLQREVQIQKADVGLALDGDADRLIVVDEHGSVIDGDQVMALIAGSWSASGQLTGDVVATVMSNLGLERYVQGLGLTFVRTPVGDRYVVETMRARGSNLGGEQSGHIILGDYGTTGDGLVAALQVLAVLVQSGRPLSEVGRVFTPLPQLLKNVRFVPNADGVTPLDREPVLKAIETGRQRLGDGGRLVIRKSGTEPLIRVMGEGDDADLVAAVVADITHAVSAACAPDAVAAA